MTIRLRIRAGYLRLRRACQAAIMAVGAPVARKVRQGLAANKTPPKLDKPPTVPAPLP